MSKPKQSNADFDDTDAGKWPGRHSRVRVDNRLASLYQGTLEEAIPDEMMRLAARIGAQLSGKS